MATLGKLAVAVLGVLAYANREKLGTMLRSDLGTSSGGKLGGLGDVLDRFRNAGRGDEVDSWVKQGPNKPLRPEQVESAIDTATIDELSRQTGMSREELLDRLSRDLPEAVDKMTPNGEMPDTTAEADPRGADGGPLDDAGTTAPSDRKSPWN